MHIVVGIIAVLQMIFGVFLIVSNNTIMLAGGAVLWSGGLVTLMLVAIYVRLDFVRSN